MINQCLITSNEIFEIWFILWLVIYGAYWKKLDQDGKWFFFMACLIILTHNETEINLVYFCCLRKFLACDMAHIIWAIIWWKKDANKQMWRKWPIGDQKMTKYPWVYLKVTFIYIITSFLHSTFTAKGVVSSKIDSSSVEIE